MVHCTNGRFKLKQANGLFKRGVIATLKLGVLDQSGIVTGGSPVQAMAQTLELAAMAERLGYSRYWLSEHHAAPGLAGSSPEVLMAAIAARTSRIRVGSAGVLLSNYSPYKVAENFRVLEALYPGRIDLGIGRSYGGTFLSTEALRYGAPVGQEEAFIQKLKDLNGFLYDALERGHPFEGLRAAPIVTTVPELWLLGSGGYSAGLASQLGAAFSYAHFIKGFAAGQEEVRSYYRQFRPGLFGRSPLVNVCVHVICAETGEEAERLAAPVALRMLLIEKGQLGRTYLTPEEAASYRLSDEDTASVQAHRVNRIIAGDPGQVKRQLLRLCHDYQTEELIVLTMVHDFEARKRSYELLARMMLH